MFNFMTTPSARAQTWMCALCSFNNDANRDTCEVCTIPAHVHVHAPIQAPARAPAQCACRACTFLNRAGASACSMCGTLF